MFLNVTPVFILYISIIYTHVLIFEQISLTVHSDMLQGFFQKYGWVAGLLMYSDITKPISYSQLVSVSAPILKLK